MSLLAQPRLLRRSAPAPIRSLVLTPAVVAHRGASGDRPEHTLEAYRLAIHQGADDIELDLVPTKDGVLVARHDAELGQSTDVAKHPEFRHRRSTRVVDGEERNGWFVEDFTFAEIKTLTARERFRKIRRANTEFHGQLGIPSLNEVLAMVAAETVRSGRTIGVMLEIKHAAYYTSLGLSPVPSLLADLRRHGLDHPRSRVTVMAFEPTVLQELAGRTRVSLVQLLHRKGSPADRPDARFEEMWTPAGLAAIDEYADGVGVHKGLVLSPTAEGRLAPTGLVTEAHKLWLTVHVWTLRRENRFLPEPLRSSDRPGGRGDFEAEARAYLEAGVDGLITDHPDLALAVREEFLRSAR